ncbi:MAG: GNAT family N-acetyltransferase [Phycisphaerae bacterium]|nr:GNAT family N-acetyltransferase [Phycisphaerae bacterium]
MTIQQPMTLRAFQVADLQPVRGLVTQTIDVSFAGVYAPSAIRHFKRHHSGKEILDDAAGGYAVVLERNGAIVATGTLTAKGKITRVYVRPDLQGQGLGKRIMAHLEQQARGRGHTSVFLNASLVARAFYEALGYRLREAKSATMEDGQRLEYFEMDRPLADPPHVPRSPM